MILGDRTQEENAQYCMYEQGMLTQIILRARVV